MEEGYQFWRTLAACIVCRSQSVKYACKCTDFQLDVQWVRLMKWAPFKKIQLKLYHPGDNNKRDSSEDCTLLGKYPYVYSVDE